MNIPSSEIIQGLRSLEVEDQMRVLYACESGSRAWGFPSRDSDYDVRFLYLHPRDWYLSVFAGRDVIERPIAEGLDLSGWDLRKALQLFSRSNPPLMEWLVSPIVYLEPFSVAGRLRALATDFYHPTRSLYHYFSMARGNYREYLQCDTVWVKKYFYVLRPLLAMRWVEAGWGVPPTDFRIAVERTLDDPELRAAIQSLVESKRAGAELDRGPRIAVISAFIDAEMRRWEQQGIPSAGRKPDTAPLDVLFRDALTEVWG